jgi:hypothetical protein
MALRKRLDANCGEKKEKERDKQLQKIIGLIGTINFADAKFGVVICLIEIKRISL